LDTFEPFSNKLVLFLNNLHFNNAYFHYFCAKLWLRLNKEKKTISFFIPSQESLALK